MVPYKEIEEKFTFFIPVMGVQERGDICTPIF